MKNIIRIDLNDMEVGDIVKLSPLGLQYYGVSNANSALRGKIKGFGVLKRPLVFFPAIDTETRMNRDHLEIVNKGPRSRTVRSQIIQI